ncbi:Npt1/Npt2 family nucleotide transporter [Candidatus Nucleicultrix amoebiphila]|jgi:AAA family ATP:ADP antiporter|uniref:ADP,ATP carrier protein n=1 Tax=Candidatus Nucleicultrix amoebiphila FS5 TaxID=1414854 RepID=A0A1W6N3J5_9PROT|nr:Npt1/Npt2 family nucleotide transporter [Candidatus Nucleicultrix amoebiphila]ARN84359.1 ATPase AAA [Candidatus Nucleicultrix amoebiphila FS5]
MSKNTPQEFGKLRAALWPIHGYELKKFLPMGFMMFFILFNYTILRDVKDALVVTAPKSGAEVIPFIKGWLVVASAFVFFFVYTKLTNIFSAEKLFYGIVIFFIAFFGLFAFFIYPNRELFHPSQDFIQQVQDSYPRLRYIVAIYGIWSYAVFYMMAELWGSVMVSLLFWQFANEITRTQEAKRFYALFTLIANVALIFSGETIARFSELEHAEGVDSWGVSLRWMMGTVVVFGAITMFIYRWMQKNVLTNPMYYDAAEAAQSKTKKVKKPKLGIMESLKFIFTNPYLGLLAILVIGYGVSINIIELLWKSRLKEAFPDPNSYAWFMGNFSKYTGIVTMALIFMTKGVVRKFGWMTAAIVTPLIVFITGGLFFLFIAFDQEMTLFMENIGLVGFTALMLAAYIGAAQNILSKGTKYSLFDPTKEMAYIPLDQESKVKGKAAVDVIGGRLGKGMGGWINQGLLLITAGNAMTIFPYLSIIVSVVVLIWLISVKALNTRYLAMLKASPESSK